MKEEEVRGERNEGGRKRREKEREERKKGRERYQSLVSHEVHVYQQHPKLNKSFNLQDSAPVGTGSNRKARIYIP